MAKQFKDDDYQVIKSDIDRLRLKTTMYISNKGPKGALHLCREAINNAIDEAMSDLSPCDLIEITFNKDLNQLMVMDNGRGIPFNMVETICIYMHSGSNIAKENTKDNAAEVAGENGVGTAAINSLSKVLYFVINRDGESKTFIFDDAKLKDVKTKKIAKNIHGTTIVFQPDEKWLGKCNIDGDELYEWINSISYTIPPKVKLKFNIVKGTKKGKEKVQSFKFSHKDGISELIDEMVPSKMIKPIRLIQKPSDYPDGKTHTDVVFTIKEGDISDATNIKSYCNRVVTIDHGTHVIAAKVAWCRTAIAIANEYMTDNEKSKYKVTFEDCRMGLSAVIVLNTPVPGFTGQTKQKVDNDLLMGPITAAIQKDLLKYFKFNPTEAKKLATIIKNTVKNRIAVSKIRKSDYKPLDTFEANTSKVYSPCKSNSYRELWIMEGDSAKGRFTAARDPQYQAAFKLKGNPKNVYGCSIVDILANKEFKLFTKILGCGVGKDYSLKKLKFDKIIFFVDSDIDGWNMVSLLSAFFLWTFPEIVEDGRVYRAMAPFYIMKTKKKEDKYILSKNEYFNLFADKVSKTMRLINGSHRMSPKEMRELISVNKEYLDELEPLVRYYSTNNEILEFAILNGKKKNFGTMLTKKFPELVYDAKNQVVKGAFNNTYQYLEIGDMFYEHTARLGRIIHNINKDEIYYKLEDNGEVSKKLISLGTFFMYSKKYLPEVDKRIKGIGELPVDDLWDTTLNPQNRELTRLTISDLERELETVKLLHGHDADLRKDFMKDYIFNKDDLDT